MKNDFQVDIFRNVLFCRVIEQVGEQISFKMMLQSFSGHRFIKEHDKGRKPPFKIQRYFYEL